jgi:hypothetical protein
MAIIPPIPAGSGEPVECPWPFVSQARVYDAHGAIGRAYELALKAHMQPLGRDPMAAALQAAREELASRPGEVRGRTDLEAVTWFALMRGKVPSEEAARSDHLAAARLAVWLTVSG